MATLKISDLSVGDWVRYKGKECTIASIYMAAEGYPHEVALTYQGISCGVAYIDHLEPTPITAEILEKNGFTLCEDCTSRWKKEFSSCCVFVTAPEGYASVTVYKRVAHGHRRVIDDLQLNGVHQLQHALRLAGVDKEINL